MHQKSLRIEIFNIYFIGHSLYARAEDELEDDIVAVENEGDNEELTTTEEAEDDTKTTASPDAETTILFTKPVPVAGSQLGNNSLTQSPINQDILLAHPNFD